MKTGLKILSVLMIIIGVLALFIGLPIVVLMLGATDGSAGGNAVVVLAAAMTLASGVFEIVGGVLGFRAADRPEKAGTAFVFGVIAMACDVVTGGVASQIYSMISNSASGSLCGSIVPLLYLICASAARKSA